MVASERAAERYGLDVLATEIADAGNVTRFAVAAASNLNSLKKKNKNPTTNKS